MMDQQTRAHVRAAANLMKRKRQIRGAERGLFGGFCTLGAVKHTGRSRTGKTMAAIDRRCQRKWGMGAIAANDTGRLKPHHLLQFAGASTRSGVRRQTAAATRAQKKEEAKQQARQQPRTGPTKKASTKTTSSAPGPCVVAGGVLMLVMVIAFASAIGTVLTWIGVALVVALVARLVWSVHDVVEVPQIDWDHVAAWRARRRAARDAIAARRAPIALGPVSPVEAVSPDEHYDLVSAWTHGQGVSEEYARLYPRKSASPKV